MKFKIGPLQEFWLQQLEKHPNKQMRGFLGWGNARNYKACCLGEGAICTYRFKKKKFNHLFDVDEYRYLNLGGSSTYYTLPSEFVNQLGLYDMQGEIRWTKHNEHNEKASRYTSLADMNDRGVTWPEIAKFIRENPSLVFKESK